MLLLPKDLMIQDLTSKATELILELKLPESDGTTGKMILERPFDAALSKTFLYICETGNVGSTQYIDPIRSRYLELLFKSNTVGITFERAGHVTPAAANNPLLLVFVESTTKASHVEEAKIDGEAVSRITTETHFAELKEPPLLFRYDSKDEGALQSKEYATAAK